MKNYHMYKLLLVFFGMTTMANMFAMSGCELKSVDQAVRVERYEVKTSADKNASRDMEVVYARSKELSRRIMEAADTLKKILSDYQTHDVSCYEIERSVRTLEGLHENSAYLGIDETIDSAAVMLPSNLPLYSLVTFALIPSFLAKVVNVRPNALLQENNIIARIYHALNLDELFPGVSIINTDHAGFKKHIRNANLVVFTGNPVNAENLTKDMRNNSVLVVNGAGHNPVVVTSSADIEKAVEGALLVKGFNGGQDCAGPDAILVHDDVAKKFIALFNERFSSLKTGKFDDPKTIIGPIARLSELQKFAVLFHKNRKDIISGGVIDFTHGIVSPTTIVRGIERSPNYEEMFGPVAFIHPYKKDQDLAYYFHDSDGRYNANRMYVTVYGHSDYISARDDSTKQNNPGNVGIVLQDKTIHDVEIGYKAYGGYSLAVSCVIKKTFNGMQKIAMPVLIPQVIAEYLIKGNNLPFARTVKGLDEMLAPTSSLRKDKQIDPIINEFQVLATQVFGENLAFGFVFGSAAKGKLKVGELDRDDLDTFICVKEDDKAAIDKYIKALVALHQKYNLKVDDTFPAEVVSLKTLEETIKSLESVVVSVDEEVTGDKFDRIFWVHALTDKKVGFIGDGKLMSSFIKDGSPYIVKWRNQIISQLENRDSLPKNLCKTFSGLTKKEAVAKLSSYDPHLVVHLGLSYDDAEKTKKQ